MKPLRLTLSVLSLGGVLLPAVAGASISVVGIVNDTMPTQTTGGSAVSMKSEFGFGGGALLGFKLSGATSLDLGALFYQVKYGDGGLNVTLFQLELPVTVHLHLGRFVFLEAGGYFADGIGLVTDSSGSSGSFSDEGINPISFGLLGGAGFLIPFGGRTALRLEGRYRFQLSNSTSSGSLALDSTASLKYSGVEVFAGVTFGLGSGSGR